MNKLRLVFFISWQLVTLNLSAQCLSGNCANGSGVYDFPGGSRYTGQFKDWKPSGVGSCAYSDGRKYQGEWLEGYPHGSGLMIYADGSRKRGIWSKGVLMRETEVRGAQGEFKARSQPVGCVSGDCQNGDGIYIFPSGAVYIGQFQNGEVHGVGVCDYSDGSRYQGEWKNRFPDGTGTKTYPDGSRRTGRWERGQPIDNQGNWIEAVARLQGDDSTPTDIQSGCISGNCQNGTGTMAYPDGSRYDGSFTDGKPQGQGVFRYANLSQYSGQLVAGLPHGRGELQRPDGAVLSGKWEKGEFVGPEDTALPQRAACIEGNCNNGTGVYLFKNGARYSGTFLHYMPHGTGTIWYPNGEKYTGDVAEGALHGYGTLYLSDGTPVAGYWQAGVWMGEQAPAAETRPIQAPASIPPSTYTPAPHTPNRPKVWALVVGVAAYNHMPTLRYTDDDAYRLYAFLKSPGGGAVPDEQLRILIDESATRDQILAAMETLFSNAGPNDMVVLYFSGHGLKGSFLPFDFDGFGNKLRHEEITEALRKSKAKYKLCIVDACHSGSLLSMRGAAQQQQLISTFYEQLAQAEGGTALFLSSKSEETSLESSGLRQGVFSHFLIRGLKGEADADNDRLVTIQELYEFVYTNVRSYTGMLQSPMITGDYDRKMVLAVKP